MKNEELAYKIWQRVDIKRKAMGYTLEDIAVRAGMKVQRIKAQRTRTIIPQADDLCLIARILQTTCEYLVLGKEDAPMPFAEYIPFLERCPPDRLESVRILLGMNVEKKSSGSVGNSGTKVG